MRISDWSSDVCSSDLELEIEGLEIILERDQLLAARRLVDAVHDGRLLRLQRLRRRDIGSDHIILDQLVRVEPFTRGDREDAALLVQFDPPFGQVEIERFTLLARGVERAPAIPQRLERLDMLAFAGIDRRLRSEEHTSELQSLMRISYAVFCLKKKNNKHYCICR